MSLEIQELRATMEQFATEEKAWREKQNMQLHHEICEVNLPNGSTGLVFVFIDNPTAHVLFTNTGEVTVYSFPGDDAAIVLRSVLDLYNTVANNHPVGRLGCGGVLAPVFDKEKGEVSYVTDFQQVMFVHTVEALKGRLLTLEGIRPEGL